MFSTFHYLLLTYWIEQACTSNMQVPKFEVVYLGDDWKNIIINVDVSLEDVSYGYYSQYYPELFIHHLSFTRSENNLNIFIRVYYKNDFCNPFTLPWLHERIIYILHI